MSTKEQYQTRMKRIDEALAWNEPDLLSGFRN